MTVKAPTRSISGNVWMALHIASPQNDDAIGGGSATPSTPGCTASTPSSKLKRHRNPRNSVLRRPRQQGDIDGLCGFYAVLNALRVAYEPIGGLSSQHELLIWASLVRYADRKWRFALLFLGGTHTYQFLDLARYSVKLAYKLTGDKVVLKPLLRSDFAACAAPLDAAVEAMTRKGCRSILAAIESKDTSHWTVITGISASTLRVLDSDGFHFLRLEGCRLDFRNRPNGNPRYWIRLYGGFAL